jgi:hypothetical protein
MALALALVDACNRVSVLLVATTEGRRCALILRVELVASSEANERTSKCFAPGRDPIGAACRSKFRDLGSVWEQGAQVRCLT